MNYKKYKDLLYVSAGLQHGFPVGRINEVQIDTTTNSIYITDGYKLELVDVAKDLDDARILGLLYFYGHVRPRHTHPDLWKAHT